MITTYSMRTHPLLLGTANTDTVNLGITTKCSMRCPNCSIDINGIRDRGEARHRSVLDLAQDINTLTDSAPLRRVHVTGGEPTLHPDFHWISVLLMQKRNIDKAVKHLTLETNGFRYDEHKDIIYKVFDLVFITHYEKDAVYPGSPDNTAIIERAQRDLGDRLVVEPPVRHLPGHSPYPALQNPTLLKRAAAGDKTLLSPMEIEGMAEREACSKWHNPGLPAGLYDGNLYACCVSVGIDRGLGIPLTTDWREVLKTPVMKGCFQCAFRGT